MESRGTEGTIATIKNRRGFAFKAPLGFSFSRYFLGKIERQDRVYKDQRDCLMIGDMRPSTLGDILNDFYHRPPSIEGGLKIILISPMINKACQEALLKDLEAGKDKITFIFLVSNKASNNYLAPIKSRLGETLICNDLHPKEEVQEAYQPFISDYHDLKMIQRNDEIILDALKTLDASSLLKVLRNNTESYTAWVGIITHHAEELLDSPKTNRYLYKISNTAIREGKPTKKDDQNPITYISLVLGLIKITKSDL